MLDCAVHGDKVAEWLRRWIANPLCSARVGSNPILVEFFSKIYLCRIFLIFMVITSFCLTKQKAYIDRLDKV